MCHSLTWISVIALLVPGFSSAARVKPVLTLDPPWKDILTRDKVTLKCKTSPMYWNFQWYRDGNFLSYGDTYTIHSAEVTDSGNYTCQRSYWKDTAMSDPVPITVIDASVVLQLWPQTVTEGDTVTLRCHYKHWFSQAFFYKDGIQFQSQSLLNKRIDIASKRDEGSYRCEINSYNERKKSGNVKLSVRDLFRSVSLTALSSSTVLDGEPIFLHCEVQVSQVSQPARPLQYSFYRGSQPLAVSLREPWYNIARAEFSRSNGSYSCAVQLSSSSSVSKRSAPVNIQVQGLPVWGVRAGSVPVDGRVLEGAVLTLSCSVDEASVPLWFGWHRQAGRHTERLNLQLSPDKRAEMKLTVTEEHGGNYSCWASYGQEEQETLSQPISVTVLVPVSPPTLSLLSSSPIRTVGSEVVFQCVCSRGTPPIFLSVFWEDGDGLGNISKLPSQQVEPSQPVNFSLSLMREEDSGSYRCQAANELSEQQSSSDAINITVVVPVSRVNLSVSPSTGHPDSPTPGVTLLCSVLEGTGPYSVSWFRDGEKLNLTSGLGDPYTLSPEGGRLTFDPLHSQVQGRYQCSAQNRLLRGIPQYNSTRSNSVEVRVPGVGAVTAAAVSVVLMLAVAVATAGLWMLWRRKRRAAVGEAPKTAVPQEPHPRDGLAPPVPQMRPGTQLMAAETDGNLLYAMVDIKKKSKVKRGTDNTQNAHGPEDALEYSVIYSKLAPPTSEPGSSPPSSPSPLYGNLESVYENVA
ncbi:Fc receptor-like protein 3 [Lepisosteus oculatus]|uniref:Fc receptor-like protein 3 n=1 Tax=Lepisosteus oculatus TaxID=7918 RepID=UPI00371ED3BC